MSHGHFARFAEHLAACPLVAIVRGVRPEEAEAVGAALIGAGIAPETMRSYLDPGAPGFGLGSGLHSPGRSAREVAERARAYVDALRER